jgi:mono/diheme cytochrome c family protein
MKPIFATTLLLITAFTAHNAPAADSMPSDAAAGRPNLMGLHITQTAGPALYETVCQGCHMPNGVGATGAGFYPALAKNAKLAAKGFPILRVLDGSKAMPPFKGVLTDAQIAAVVAYVRTHFGNAFPDEVSAADVQALRK